ncbi:MAG: histidine triad (HIT) family protein [Candidatus Nanohaloarchaea archaeon]|jgi:histidine triad (HIT) family protein
MPPGQGDECIYCQLIDNPDQLMLVGETEHFYAWLEVQPRAKGHTQVVPKEHIESVMELGPQQYQEAMKLVREVVEKSMEGLGADGASVTMNIKEAGGQMMPHMYISVFPRFSEDENAGTPTGAIFQHREELQDESKLQEIQGDMESVTVDFDVEKVEPHPESKRFKEKSSGSGETEVSEEEDGNDRSSGKGKHGKSFEWV